MNTAPAFNKMSEAHTMKQATNQLAAYQAFARALVAVAARVAREQQARRMLQSASHPSSTKEKAA